MHTLCAGTASRAAVRNSRLKHLLTCRWRLIWLSAMTRTVSISSGEDLFFLCRPLIFGIHIRELHLKLTLMSSFAHFRITKALQKVIWVPSLRSACWSCPPICCVMHCCCNFCDHVTSFLCDPKKIPPVSKASSSMFMLKCSWMRYLRKGWWSGEKKKNLKGSSGIWYV